jgi:hypothetical protein
LRDTWRLACSFYEGMQRGIRENNRRQRESLNKDDANRFALVLVDKDALIKKTFEAVFKNVKLKAVNRGIDWNAANSGYEKGKEIKLNAGLQGGAQNAELSR